MFLSQLLKKFRPSSSASTDGIVLSQTTESRRSAPLCQTPESNAQRPDALESNSNITPLLTEVQPSVAASQAEPITALPAEIVIAEPIPALIPQTPPEEISIYIQSTPNPNAYKFITSKDVKVNGTATYQDPDACDNEFARALLNVTGVEQIYFFDNVITATINSTVPLHQIKDHILAVIKDKLPAHDPSYKTEDDHKQESYDNLPEGLKRINEILDRTIRPGLQGDGGNIEILSLVDNQLSVRYEGACGTCPSSTMGTLQAINQILRDEFDPDIEVVSV